MHPLQLLRLVAALGLALAWPSAASAHAAKVVGPGDSIQAAVDAARPGDTILVHGTHRENVAVQTDGLKLRGRDAVLLPPATPSAHACFDPTGPGEAVHGICVIGDVDFETGSVSRYVERVSVTGFTARGYPGAGLVAVGARDTTFAHNRVAGSEDGIASASSIGTSVLGNELTGGRFGTRVFSDADAVVAANSLHDNCVGAFVLDARDTQVLANAVTRNTRACAGDEDFPALSGLGVGLVGAMATTVTGNWITGNVPRGETAGGGGVAAIASPDGTPLIGNRVRGNVLRGNEPDLSWDGSGTGNVFTPNVCRTSVPAGLCPAGIAVARPLDIAGRGG
jgi:nitrous oxidase accessory protein NosD